MKRKWNGGGGGRWYIGGGGGGTDNVCRDEMEGVMRGDGVLSDGACRSLDLSKKLPLHCCIRRLRWRFFPITASVLIASSRALQKQIYKNHILIWNRK